MAIRASEEGLKRIQAAIADRGSAENSTIWVDQVIQVNAATINHPEIKRKLENFSQSSWRRFVKNEGVSLQTFRWCCVALGLNSDEIQLFGADTPVPEIYIARQPLESRCDREIQQPGALLRVRGPRQLGKTRLLSWILAAARQRGDRTVLLDMQTADDCDRADLTTWLQWFCRATAGWLGVEPAVVAADWDEEDGPKTNCNNFWRDRFLKPSDRPLVVALDNVDLLFNRDDGTWEADFFGLLRSWFDKARTQPLWGKLRLILSYSTEVYIKLDINQSPFNVGHEARLPNFTLDQASQWADRLELELTSSQVADLVRVTSGYPCLLELAWRALQGQTPESVVNLLAQAPTLQGVYRSHLNELYDLAKKAKLGEAIAQMVASNEAVSLDLETMRLLERLGLGRFEGHGMTWRCALYRDFFAAHPIR